MHIVSQIMYGTLFFAMMIMHLKFFENWSGKSGRVQNFVEANEWQAVGCMVKVLARGSEGRRFDTRLHQLSD